MPRVVIGIETSYDGKRDQLYLLEPTSHEGERTLDINAMLLEAISRIELDIENADSANPAHNAQSMEALGKAVYEVLRTHPVIDSEAADHFTIHNPTLSPLYFFLNTDKARLLDIPWEAIHAPDAGFLAQSRNYAVARAIKLEGYVEPWLFRPPLRVMAVLGVNTGKQNKTSALGQYKALREALAHSELAVRLHVLSCEPRLVARIRRDGRSMPEDQQIEAEFLRSAKTLRKSMETFQPHILHFFCHGKADEQPAIQIATQLSWTSGIHTEDIMVGAGDIKQFGATDDSLLLVTLACCEGASQGSGSTALSMSLAQQLVSVGVPAVVGMRKPILTGLADTFSELFYQELLKELTACVASANGHADGGAEVHLACALHALRRSLFNHGQASPSLQWTMPVLYTRLAPFRIKVDMGEAQSRAMLAQERALARTEHLLKKAPRRMIAPIQRARATLDARLKSQQRGQANGKRNNSRPD
ncbi:CHAT domain-containing protein [Massilia sp. DWR3-1-1]|uniref:CHAT domain-containing protein n=1 Tax=Massilia sp. DWR3-1-1 TaxID=2804559 RepID=UPI003CF5E189